MHRTRWLATAVLALAVAATAGCGSTTAKAPPFTVTADGTGQVFAAPDTAQMRFDVAKKAAKPKAALDMVSEAGDALIKGLKAAGIADGDLRTSNVAVSPQYKYQAGQTRVVGYQARITVNVTSKDLERAGDVIEAGVNAGATSVSGPNFSLSQTSPARKEALTDATKDAEKDASSMAKAAGRSLGRVVSLTELPGPAYQPYADQYGGFALRGIQMAQMAPPIEPGRLEVRTSVKAVYALR